MAQKRTGLGRGIGALIPSAPTQGERPVDVFFPSGPGATDLVAIPGASLAALPPSAIGPNPQQPRKEFHQEELDELIHSVAEFGVLQPIVVRPLAQPQGPIQYELIMGERRLRAATAAGLATIPAVVRETEDDAMLRDALLENLHRANLNALEEASAYQQLLSDFGITQDELATKLGRSRPQVTNTLRLLRLPADVQKKVAAVTIQSIVSSLDIQRIDILKIDIEGSEYEFLENNIEWVSQNCGVVAVEYHNVYAHGERIARIQKGFRENGLMRQWSMGKYEAYEFTQSENPMNET